MSGRSVKWRKWLFVTILCLVILTGAAYIGLELAVDYALKSLLAGSASDERIEQALDGDLDAIFNIPSDDPDSASRDEGNSIQSGESGDVESTSPDAEMDDGSEDHSRERDPIEPEDQAGHRISPNDKGDSLNDDQAGITDQAEGAAPSGRAEPDGTAPTDGSDRSDNSKRSSGNSKTGDLSYTPEVTKEKAEAVQNSITLGEKLKVARVLLKRLEASDVDLFLKMMSGGMSVQEKRIAKNIMLDRLTAEEYNDLIKIAEKYGLSQGKSYEDSLKE